MVFKKLFARQQAVAPRVWSLPQGERVYAIGDIHGRLDLFDQLLAKIDADDIARGAADTTLVILGDLADRGPDSRGVIERLIDIKASPRKTVFLMGNHEELLIRTWEGERGTAGTFNRVGGRDTMYSYGVSEEDYNICDLGELTTLVANRVPRDHIDFLRSFADWHHQGDYLFVHAGIRPGFEIEDQDPVDLRWIRGDFTGSLTDHGYMVVHGHSITPEVDEQPNRIGIDTGAFASGILTAIGLEGGERWYIATGPSSSPGG
jgi:serine/threonine protein phosphatase 1